MYFVKIARPDPAETVSLNLRQSTFAVTHVSFEDPWFDRLSGPCRTTRTMLAVQTANCYAVLANLVSKRSKILPLRKLYEFARTSGEIKLSCKKWDEMFNDSVPWIPSKHNRTG